MSTTIQLIIRLLTTTATKWWDGNPWRLSAALSYYTLFSLAPLLTLAVAFAAVVVDEHVVQGELRHQLEDLIGEHVHGTVATLISFITLFIVSMGLFSPERRYGRCGGHSSSARCPSRRSDDGDRHHGITLCHGRSVHAHV